MTLEQKQVTMKERNAGIVLNIKPDKPIPGVYIVGSSQHNWYKIGYSHNLNARVIGYRSLPFVLDTQITWTLAESQCRLVEKRLHALVEPYRISANGGYSEWFDLTRADLADITNAMAGYPSVTIAPVSVSLPANCMATQGAPLC